MTNIEKLLDLSNRLVGLLKEPEPGIFTWHDAVHRLLTEIADFAASKVHVQVKEFMDAVGQVRNKTPTVPDEATVRLRARLVLEEAFEFAEAMFVDHSESWVKLHWMKLDALGQIDQAPANDVAPDVPLVADALADLDYVVEGSRIAFGIDGIPIADEVHRANMTKLGGPIVNLKQMKPEGWKPPDIEGCLRKQGWKGP